MRQIICSLEKKDDFLKLCDMLEDELDRRVGINNRLEYKELNSLTEIKNYYIAYINNQPIGCACVKEYNISTLEIKRVFVIDKYRKKGVAKEIMYNIILDAKKSNYTSIILETGKPLFEAMNLYEKLGFKRIKNYGSYRNLKKSICMQKVIGENETI